MKPTDPWCAAFVSAVGWACGLSGIVYPECSCDRMISLYQVHGRWCENDDYHAKPGDVIFYDWQDSGSGDNRGESDHVGLVVEDADHYMVIIEGNHSDAVGKRTLAYGSQYIRGFGLPDYVTAASEGTPAPDDDCADPPASDPPSQESNHNQCLVKLPVLRQGDESESVRSAQRILIGRGYSCGGSWSWVYQREFPDGEFGPKTASAVREFRSEAGLDPGDEIDGDCWISLITK